MAKLCEKVDEVTQQCLLWIDYVPVIPELTTSTIAEVWGWFLGGLLLAWGFKKVIRLFGW